MPAALKTAKSPGVTATALPLSCPPYAPLTGIMRVVEPTVLDPQLCAGDQSARPRKHSAGTNAFALSDVRQFYSFGTYRREARSDRLAAPMRVLQIVVLAFCGFSLTQSHGDLRFGLRGGSRPRFSQ
jgi:hypothetical protein